MKQLYLHRRISSRHLKSEKKRNITLEQRKFLEGNCFQRRVFQAENSSIEVWKKHYSRSHHSEIYNVLRTIILKIILAAQLDQSNVVNTLHQGNQGDLFPSNTYRAPNTILLELRPIRHIELFFKEIEYNRNLIEEQLPPLLLQNIHPFYSNTAFPRHLKFRVLKKCKLAKKVQEMKERTASLIMHTIIKTCNSTLTED